MHILLIEDDKNLCDILTYQLEQEGFSVDLCHDGRDGLDLMLQNAHDLIILDRMLPTMNGLMALQKARANHIETPVILLTALGELYDRIEGLDCGADDYIVKPFAFEELMARIRTIRRRSRSIMAPQILTLANSDARSLQLHFQPEKLDEILLDTYEKYEALAKKQKISLSLQLPQELLPDCSCDRERMEQVLTILMDNALSYVPEGGRITLALEQKNTSLEIRVIDNGPGIPREEQEKIFERFYRREASRTSRHHYGLGLCIAREILRCHHGSIHAEDTSGGGATFVVQLPLPKALPS